MSHFLKDKKPHKKTLTNICLIDLHLFDTYTLHLQIAKMKLILYKNICLGCVLCDHILRVGGGGKNGFWSKWVYLMCIVLAFHTF